MTPVVPDAAVVIRPATEADLGAIQALAAWAADHTVANFASPPEPVEVWHAWWSEGHVQYPWLVLVLDGKVVGFAKAGPYRARAAYRWTVETTIYLAPEVHGKRLGTRLYRVLLDLLRAQGFRVVVAGVTTEYPPSEKLHEAMGFKLCGALPSVGYKFGAWHDVGFWVLDFGASDPPADPRTFDEVWTSEPDQRS